MASSLRLLHAEREAILINEEDREEWEERVEMEEKSAVTFKNMIKYDPYVYLIVYTMSTVKVFVDIYLFVGSATPCNSPLPWSSIFWINFDCRWNFLAPVTPATLPASVSWPLRTRVGPTSRRCSSTGSSRPQNLARRLSSGCCYFKPFLTKITQKTVI
jgi:hypothetical protein